MAHFIGAVGQDVLPAGTVPRIEKDRRAEIDRGLGLAAHVADRDDGDGGEILAGDGEILARRLDILNLEDSAFEAQRQCQKRQP